MNLDVIITKKNIKNLILRVKPDGKIYLSVPKRTTQKVIKEFLNKNSEWILKTLKKIETYNKNIYVETYINGSTIFYLGKKYKLKIIIATKNSIILENDNIIIYSKETTEKYIETILYKWYREKAKEIFYKTLSYYSDLTKLSFSQMKILKMKRKWGSCRYLTGVITFNLELIKKDISCIEYVALHEIAHIKHPHHKKEFWDFISLYMLDWKKRRDLLQINEVN